MKIAVNGKIIDIPSGGPSGPDGNPIGTVISYMGTTAPKDYLICDGAEYNVADYADLARHFMEQFGSANYFGGDGTTTFAVPDMRNLFLRGFHGFSAEQLSGDVGVKQEGTKHQNVYASGTASSHYLYAPNYTKDYTYTPPNSDTKDPNGSLLHTSFIGVSSVQSPNFYTSRPVNMAVLYCIKATVAESYENVYSTEETRIGTWSDGKPIYQRCFNLTTPDTLKTTTPILSLDENIRCVDISGVVHSSDGSETPVNLASSGTNIWCWQNYKGYSTSQGNHIYMTVTIEVQRSVPVTLILKYTKTTDTATKTVTASVPAMTYKIPQYDTAMASDASTSIEVDVPAEKEV